MQDSTSRWEILTAAIGSFVTAHPAKIAFAVLLATALMVIPFKNTDTSTKMSDYLPECDCIAADQTVRREFDAVFTVVSILESASGNILDEAGLALLYGHRGSHIVVAGAKRVPDRSW